MPLDVDHVGARHHHLADDGVAELEHRVDHLPLAGLDHRGLLGQVDQRAQLGLGRERALGEPLARGERVADQDQQLRQRAEHPGQRHHRTGRDDREPVGVLPAERARRDADDHVRDQTITTAVTRMCYPGDRRRRPDSAWVTSTIAVISQLSRSSSREFRYRGASDEQVAEPDRAQVALLDLLVRPDLGVRRQRGLGAGEQTGEQDEHRGHNQQNDVVGAQRNVTPVLSRSHQASASRFPGARHASSRRPWTSHISAFSAGSAWS